MQVDGEYRFRVASSGTANAAITWRNVLFLDNAGSVDIMLHDAATLGLKLGGTLVTASAAELNIMDGVTATTAEINQLDDNTLTNHLTLHITDTDGDTEGDIWYDASEDKLKFKTAAGVETITSS